MRQIDALTHAEMERTGHEEVNFPLLIPEDLLEKENALVARLKRAREEGVDPDELRDEDEEAGFKKKSIGSSTLVKMTSISQCSCGQQVKRHVHYVPFMDSKSQRFTSQSVPNGQYISLRDQANSFIYSSS